MAEMILRASSAALLTDETAGCVAIDVVTRTGRAPLRPMPHCTDLPGTPAPGAYPAWIVAIVAPQSEERARAWLWHRARIVTWLPMRLAPRARGGRRHAVVRESVPLVRGYLLVPEMYAEHAICLRAPGVSGFIHYDGWPRLIRDEDLAQLREDEQNLSDRSYVERMMLRRYAVGARVRLLTALFEHVEGVVIAIDRRGRLTVEVDGIGRVSVARCDAEPIEARDGKNASRHHVCGRSGKRRVPDAEFRRGAHAPA